MPSSQVKRLVTDIENLLFRARYDQNINCEILLGELENYKEELKEISIRIEKIEIENSRSQRILNPDVF